MNTSYLRYLSARTMLVILVLLALAPITLEARPVSRERAASAAAGVLAGITNGAVGLSERAQPLLAVQVRSADGRTLVYVFTAPDSIGFVLIAGDDAVSPVLGYSFDSPYSTHTVAPSFRWWIGHYSGQVENIMRMDLEAPPEIESRWRRLESGRSAAGAGLMEGASVAPLVTTKWNQGRPYNDQCPLDRARGQRAVTGCVATSFAQIMRFHAAPITGVGSHSYVHPYFGRLYANYSGVTYDWSRMPAVVNGPNSEVAKLMFHLGVAAEMSYSVESSGAYPRVLALGLARYFGYKSTIRTVRRAEMSDAAWVSLIRSELDARRPVEYNGYGDGAGHSFVCDGYQGEYFHMNWGWGGSFDGYFLLSRLVPDGVGTGGGSGNFTDDQGATVGIEPAVATAPSVRMVMVSGLEVSPNPAYAVSTVTATFDVTNAATSTFRGDYCVAIFDADGEFVTFLGEILDGVELPPDYHFNNGLVFRDTLFGITPGTYTVQAFARPTGGEWHYIEPGGEGNSEELTIVTADYGNPVALWAPITVEGEGLFSDGSFSIHADFANTADEVFTGSIGLFLFTMDGKLVGNGAIAVRDDLRLNARSHWLDGLTFSNDRLNAAPGQYILAFYTLPDASSRWIPVNSGEYANPVIVDVLPARLQADRYEPNDVSSGGRRLPYVFSSNLARVQISDANFHRSGDVDYYSLRLEPGYEYDVTVNLSDAGNEGAAGYTADVSVLCRINGQWSNAADEKLMRSRIRGDQDLLIKIQPLFAGTSGTYEATIDVRRRQVSSVPETKTPVSVRIVPNPARDHVLVSLPSDAAIHHIELIDLRGAVMRSMSGDRGTQAWLDVASVPSGSYVIRITTAGAVIDRPLMIVR